MPLINKKIVVTGGGGFIGSHLVRKLVHTGASVTVIDNMTRGDSNRLSDVAQDISILNVDIRDEPAVTSALKGTDVVMHLAAINGTENFYKNPELVLDVGIRGALAVVNGCLKNNIPDLVVASSAEVYQTPKIIPTPENVPLMLPNSKNARYSYGGSKIISELIALNYGKEKFEKLQIFRPHNVYGPDMGWKHVIPQFIVRCLEISNSNQDFVDFPIIGSAEDTRAFAYVSDVVDGILTMYSEGHHREIYHIGNDDEITISNLVNVLGSLVNMKLCAVSGESAIGSAPRRCPDITKMRDLGYRPNITLTTGLSKTLEWYRANRDKNIHNELM